MGLRSRLSKTVFVADCCMLALMKHTHTLLFLFLMQVDGDILVCALNMAARCGLCLLGAGFPLIFDRRRVPIKNCATPGQGIAGL